MPPKKPADVLVDVALLAAIRHPLTYRVPPGLDVRTGQRVLAPLGHRRALGIVLEPVAAMAPGIQPRDILRVIEPEPLLSPELLALGLWIADYYLAPVGEVFGAMLPLRSKTRRVRLAELTDRGRKKLDELASSLLEEARSSADLHLLKYLADYQTKKPGGAPFESLRARFSASQPDLVPRALAEDWIAVSQVERDRGERKVMSVRLAGGAATAAAAVQGPIPERQIRLSPVALRILAALERQGPADDHRELLKAAGASLETLRKLGKAGVVELAEPAGGPRPADSAEAEREGLPAVGSWALTPPDLTPAQAEVLGQIGPRIEQAQFSVTLLYGVTGSGKTEIYLRLVERAISLGRSALMLVPEISLTPAVEMLVQTRFGNQVAVLHSGLGEGERHEAWWRARRGQVKVVLGTRSAVFAPLANLGVVIVDEEHESSYKQEETPRYHGRDVAVVRARLAGCACVLGSATPSLESYSNARQGKYHLATLKERIGSRPLASVEIIDMRQEFRQTFTKAPVSRRLHDEIQAQIDAHAQTMILLNRRGYSWFLLCRSCGQTLRCQNCSISLTYHKREHRLVCHYCGFSREVPARCPECSSEFLQYVGEGTEKIETRLAELFPTARIERVDRDTVARRGHFRKILAGFRRGEIDILVGTQLIAKGHDFPRVTLVGVASADMGLALPDFRAAERSFQLLTQAAGRAGRGERPGRVLVQTFYPEHYAIRLAAEQNYEAFFSKEMGFRRMMHYPPAAALANVIAQDTSLEKAAQIASGIGKFFETAAPDSRDLRIQGPAPAPLARLDKRYRIQFLLKARSRTRLNQLLGQLAADLDRRGVPAKSVIIDMDPVSIL